MQNTFPENCRVFITGGTGSIGRALVEGFSRVGTKVGFQYFQNETRAKEIESITGAIGVRIDFATSSVPTLDRVDILVNNAGINISKVSVEDTTEEEWDRTLQVNARTPMLLARAVLPQMKQRRWGRIINISSIYGIRIASNNAAYNVSKHGLRGLTGSIAKEYGPYGITCNELCPGPVASDLLRRIAEANYARTGIGIDAYEERLASAIPVGRIASPSDVVNAAVWLASKESSYVNGVSLPIDGGMTI